MAIRIFLLQLLAPVTHQRTKDEIYFSSITEILRSQNQLQHLDWKVRDITFKPLFWIMIKMEILMCTSCETHSWSIAAIVRDQNQSRENRLQRTSYIETTAILRLQMFQTKQEF